MYESNYETAKGEIPFGDPLAETIAVGVASTTKEKATGVPGWASKEEKKANW
jgi:hypothetical protein